MNDDGGTSNGTAAEPATAGSPSATPATNLAGGGQAEAAGAHPVRVGQGVEGRGHGRGWTFLTNHAHVLLALARDPAARLRDVAASVGITERATQAIVADLEKDGYLHRTRVGRRNHYTINSDGPFRHPNEADRRIGDLLALFTDLD
ncbi:helix-turn-helix transcriptional regulator [Actinomadura viridis]|uniref:helix-turn-helix transcriptional regulator n=1 Tax=Actinomadura viridis TaxID=58110 RepID=UPI0036B0A94F